MVHVRVLPPKPSLPNGPSGLLPGPVCIVELGLGVHGRDEHLARALGRDFGGEVLPALGVAVRPGADHVVVSAIMTGVVRAPRR